MNVAVKIAFQQQYHRRKSLWKFRVGTPIFLCLEVGTVQHNSDIYVWDSGNARDVHGEEGRGGVGLRKKCFTPPPSPPCICILLTFQYIVISSFMHNFFLVGGGLKTNHARLDKKKFLCKIASPPPGENSLLATVWVTNIWKVSETFQCGNDT